MINTQAASSLPHAAGTRRFTADDVQRMLDAGILGEDERVELWRGGFLMMSPQRPRHSRYVRALMRGFQPLLAAGRADYTVQSPIHLAADSEPEPDFALVAPRDDLYAEFHPRPEHVLLLVEVAETSDRTDRGTKLAGYAAAGIVECWLISAAQQTLTLYRDPSPRGYETMSTHRPGESLAPLKFPDHAVDLTWLLA